MGKLSTAAQLVLIHINANGQTYDLCLCTHKDLALTTQLSIHRIRQCMKELRTGGYIEITKQGNRYYPSIIHVTKSGFVVIRSNR